MASRSRMSAELLKQKGEAVRALVASDRVGIPRADLLWMASETFSFLDRLLGEVREGKNVLLASQFARWLEFSGLLKVFEGLEGGAVIRAADKELLYQCGEMFRLGKADPRYVASGIAEINRKLDLLIAGGSGAVRRGAGDVIVDGPAGQPGEELPLLGPPSKALERKTL